MQEQDLTDDDFLRSSPAAMVFELITRLRRLLLPVVEEAMTKSRGIMWRKERIRDLRQRLPQNWFAESGLTACPRRVISIVLDYWDDVFHEHLPMCRPDFHDLKKVAHKAIHMPDEVNDHDALNAHKCSVHVLRTSRRWCSTSTPTTSGCRSA